MNRSTTFECGCRLEEGVLDGVPTMLIKACSATCETVRYTLELADELDRPMRIEEGYRYTVTCVTCGKEMDDFTGIGDAVLPEPGSLSVCFYCMNVAVFDRNADGDMFLRLPTGTEQDLILADENLQHVLRAMQEYR